MPIKDAKHVDSDFKLEKNIVNHAINKIIYGKK